MRQAVEKGSALLLAWLAIEENQQKRLFPVFLRNEEKTPMIFIAHFML